MKHVKLFKTTAEFDAAKDRLAKPNIGLIEETGKTYGISVEIVPEVDYSKVAMFFENVDTQDVTIGVKKSHFDAYTVVLETSEDEKNWESWGETSETALTKNVPVGGKLYVRTTANVGYFNDGSFYNYFYSTGKVNVGGNIMSLGYKDFDDKTSITHEHAYKRVLYQMDNLVDASKLVLPATTLDVWCYSDMFNGCISLTATPKLPATTLNDYCYYNMFQGCTSLTEAPKLPASTLAEGCYQFMFSGCTSLTAAPELPATTLENGCYNYMFIGCSNLNYIKTMFTTEPSGSYTSSWVYGVSSTGTFVKNASATWDVSGVNGIPTGWTVETATAE